MARALHKGSASLEVSEEGVTVMSTAVRMVRNTPSTASEHDEMLEELPREQPEELEAWLRELRLSSIATGAVDVDEVETPQRLVARIASLARHYRQHGAIVL
jgi:hypothetical protein